LRSWCGCEPTAVLAAMGSLRESLRALSGTSGGKIKEAKMACSFGCDKACGCDCCGKPASG
jgi:hypothetical protein